MSHLSVCGARVLIGYTPVETSDLDPLMGCMTVVKPKLSLIYIVYCRHYSFMVAECLLFTFQIDNTVVSSHLLDFRLFKTDASTINKNRFFTIPVPHWYIFVFHSLLMCNGFLL